MPTQEELNQRWQDAKNGKYDNDPTGAKILADDASEQVLSVPDQDCTHRELYRRKPGGEWEPAPFLGEKREQE